MRSRSGSVAHALPKEEKRTMSLADTTLFRGADAADVAAVQALGTRVDLLPGDRLFSPGEPPRALYYIEMGSIEVAAEGKEMRVIALGSGQTVGEAAFLAGGEHAYTAKSIETTRLIAIPHDRLARLLEERPKLALVVYRNAARAFASILRQMAPLLDRPYV
jgi:CRP-like cAMP-binding protein